MNDRALGISSTLTSQGGAKHVSFFRKKPFGKNVEGLSYFRDESYAGDLAVQTHDLEDSTLCVVIGGKPLLAKRLRTFKVAAQ
jgi:hypothetical protein